MNTNLIKSTILLILYVWFYKITNTQMSSIYINLIAIFIYFNFISRPA